MLNKKYLKPLQNIFESLLPFFTVILSALQLAFSAINSISTCTIDQSYIQLYNNTAIYDTLNSQDLGTLNITLSAIISFFTVVLALYNDNNKKQKKKAQTENINLHEKVNVLTMRSFSLQHEPFLQQDTPHESINTDYPRAIHINNSDDETPEITRDPHNEA